ncbi:unnamed protein product [Sympodiomycopsis kandeliae]
MTPTHAASLHLVSNQPVDSASRQFSAVGSSSCGTSSLPSPLLPLRMSTSQSQQPPPNPEAWKAAVVRRIFNVTLDAQDSAKSGYKLTFLTELADELKSEGQATPRLDPAIADRAIIARLSIDPAESPMTDDDVYSKSIEAIPKDETSWDYLIGCWKRCSKEGPKAKKGLGSYAPEALSILDSISSLIVSYAGLLLTSPDMFPNHTKNNQVISPHVLVPSILNLSGVATLEGQASTSTSWATLDQNEIPQFLEQLAKRFDGDGLEDIIGPALTEITRRIRDGISSSPGPSSQSEPSQPDGGNQEALQAAAQAGDVRAVLAHLLNRGPQAAGNAANGALAGINPLQPSPSSNQNGMHLGAFEWRSHVLPVVDLADNKAIAAAIVNLPNFNPENTTEPRMELDSVLGPLLRLNVFSDVSPILTQQYFSNPESRSAAEKESNVRSLQLALGLVHQLHFRLYNSLVRSSPAGREQVLRYWGRIAELNRRRGAMRVRRDKVGTDGFTVNTWETLQRFAEPFMDATFSKIDKIDPEYLRRQKRFDASSLTRINASEPEANKWAEEAPESDQAPNFITEIFFLLLRLTNLGPGKAIRTYEEKSEELRRIKRELKETEEMKPTWESTPQAPQYEVMLTRLKAMVENTTAELLASSTQLMDAGFIDRLLHVAGFTMTWLVRMADPKRQHPGSKVELPLPQEVPVQFRMLPEHIFEDVCDILLFIARYKPDALPEATKKDFVTFTVTFLSSGWFIKNPFLKAKLAEIMSYNVTPFYGYPQGILGDIVNLHDLALRHLVPACMSFWVEAESTGSHTQFYDKFNIRSHLGRIFRTIWNNPQHMAKIQAEATGNSDNFVIFVNRLMNDVTYLLDDALEKLVELHSKQAEMDDESTWQERPAEERGETERHVNSLNGQVRSMLHFGQDFLQLLIDFTAQTKDAFMTPEIVSRLAAMLDYNLDLLVGPRCTELKVKDPKRVGFQPRELLKQILSVYLNLCTRSEFISAIAADGRSYRKSVFDRACNIANRHVLKSPSEIDSIQAMVSKVEEVKAAELEEEEDLGEIPDEYSDPLMATLMKNPVLLPSSKVIVDMSTIKSHLLSDSSDPFNRAPLKLEDVKPAVELQEEITRWVAEKKRQKHQQ